MKKNNSTPLRRKLFFLILVSMLTLLVCISSVFMYLTVDVQTNGENTLSEFSNDMAAVYKENEKYAMVLETGNYTRLFALLCQQYFSDAPTQEQFLQECDTAYNAYLGLNHDYDEGNDILFVYYNDYFCCLNGHTREEVEERLDSIYFDERRQCEAVFTDENGVDWVKNNNFADSYIETDTGFITIAFTYPEGYPDCKHIKVGLIRQKNNKADIDLYSQRIVEEYGEKAWLEQEKVFRQEMLLLLAAVLTVTALSFLYTRNLSGYIADPIELERQRANQEKELLEKANAMKTTFLSNVSHELKTPLAAMSGYAQNAEQDLRSGSDPSLISEKLRRISSEANRMALMVSQVLDATRIEEDRMIFSSSECDTESILRETVETYFAVLNKNNNRLMIRFPMELPKVSADPALIQRVFVNLISNALKHTHNGTIVVKAEEQGDMLSITVKDTGCGISPEDMPHIWERYYKGKDSETGTGLGLFICKYIIELHGGKIWAESEPGKGTSFTFTLPVSR